MRDYGFGNFLRELREGRGLSQYQLGRLVGVSDKAVSKWENGTAKPQSSLLYGLSDALGVTADELLACKCRPAESRAASGVFARKHVLWKQVHRALRERYGEAVPLEVLNRYLSEYARLQDSDLIVFWALLAEIAAGAKARGEHIRVRGGTGASFVAFVMGATEVNPLKPHYYCPHCRTVTFAATRCGWDLLPKACACGGALERDGHDLPFETLRPAIGRCAHVDLAVSQGMYPAVKEQIGAYFADSTVVTLVRADHPQLRTVAVMPAAAADLAGGQELPFEEYYDRVKAHPTITLMIDKELDRYRRLEKATGVPFAAAPFAAPEVLAAFARQDTGGIPEFHTDLFRAITAEASPTSFHDLVQIAGLAHATGAWENNAQALIHGGVPAGRVLAWRDDVFNRIEEAVLSHGMSGTGFAGKVMEDVCRGVYAKGGVSAAMRQQFAALGLEDWFAGAIEKIGYLFPKAHGVMTMTYILTLMWYKLHHPAAFAAIMQ